MHEAEGLQPILTVLPEGEALRLVRRAAAACRLDWSAEPEAITGLGGFEADLTHHPGREAVAWATLPGQQGVLGLAAKEKLVATAGKELGQIRSVQPVELPGIADLALMVEDRYEQLTGGFLREERSRIYIWDGRGLRQVFSGIREAEQLWHARWEDARAPQVWKRKRTVGEADLVRGDLTYTLLEQWMEAVGRSEEAVPPPAKFWVVREQKSQERLRWNPRLRRFDTE